jgi:pimeloyl-ACP methyl ester carboxylesterase
MLNLRAIESFHIGGRSVTLRGFPPEHRRLAQSAAPRAINPDGDCVTGQMYAQAFRLSAPRTRWPVLLWHGGGMTGVNWETTPDGRPGWLTRFLEDGWDVIVSDAVERGRASWSRFPDITIEDFATDVANVIEAEELWHVILVGHSLAGGAISFVADRIPKTLKQLVYLDAGVLENGESPFSKMDPTIVAQRLKLAQETSGGLTIPPPAPGAFGVTEPHDVEWLRRRLTPQPFNCYQTPIRLIELVTATRKT